MRQYKLYVDSYAPMKDTPQRKIIDDDDNEERTNMLARVFDGLTETIQASLVSFMITMRKVETSHTKTSVDKFLELWDLPARRAKRTNNLRLTLGRVRLAQN